MPSSKHNGVIKTYNIKIEICPSGCSRASARVSSPSSSLPTASTGQDRLQGSVPCSRRVMRWDMAPRLCPDAVLGGDAAPATPGQNKNEPAFRSLVDSAEWHQVLETPTPGTSAVGPDLLPSREPGDKANQDMPHRHPSHQGLCLLLCFPPTERHRHRDLISAKALLFLSSFRKKTKRQERGREEASPCISLWVWNSSTQPRSKPGLQQGLACPPAAQHPQWQQESGTGERWASLSPFPPDWGWGESGLACHNFDYLKTHPLSKIRSCSWHGSIVSKISLIILTLIYENQFIVAHIAW